jgi:hypothetical protein
MGRVEPAGDDRRVSDRVIAVGQHRDRADVRQARGLSAPVGVLGHVAELDVDLLVSEGEADAPREG